MIYLIRKKLGLPKPIPGAKKLKQRFEEPRDCKHIGMPRNGHKELDSETFRLEETVVEVGSTRKRRLGQGEDIKFQGGGHVQPHAMSHATALSCRLLQCQTVILNMVSKAKVKYFTKLD